MGGSQVIPAELVDYIIGQIDPQSEDGLAALASCSTASRVFLPFAQKRIFESTSITLRVGLYQGTVVLFEDDITTGKKLLDLLDDSPHLAVYIHRFTIVFDGRGPVASLLSLSRIISSNSPLFPLYAIVLKLTKLKAFAIRSPGHLPWKQLEQLIRNFFHQLVRTHDLEELDLITFDGLPSAILSECKTLIALHATNVVIKMDQEPPKQVNLDFLRYREMFWSSKHANMLKMFNSPFSPLSFRHLRKLVVILTDPSAVGGLLSFCSGTLECLEMWSLGLWQENIQMAYESQNTVPVLEDVLPDLSGLHRLREVVICSRVCGYGNHEFYLTDVPYACAILRKLPAHNGISAHIDASLNIIFEDVPTGCLQEIQWSELIGVNFGESGIRSTGAKFEALFSLPTEEFDEKDLLLVLQRNGYLTRLKELGLATYGTCAPEFK